MTGSAGTSHEPRTSDPVSISIHHCARSRNTSLGKPSHLSVTADLSCALGALIYLRRRFEIFAMGSRRENDGRHIVASLPAIRERLADTGGRVVDDTVVLRMLEDLLRVGFLKQVESVASAPFVEDPQKRRRNE